MATTTLFAPQVPAVQPAFINGEGEVKIYFSLSAYNEISDITSIRYTLVDPNQKSTWGTNSLFKDNFDENLNIYYQEVLKSEWEEDDPISKRYCINVAYPQLLFSEQYYQSQLYFVSTSGEENSYSPLSQVTLIRPFDGFKSIYIEGLNGSDSLYNFNKLKGYVVPNDPKSVEYIKTYAYKIFQNEQMILIYESPVIFNNLGFQFETNVDYIFAEGEYSLEFSYMTVNGYANKQNFNFSIEKLSGDTPWDPSEENLADYLTITFLADKDAGGVDITLAWQTGGFGANKIYIQRSSEKDNFLNWQNIAELEYGQELDSGTYHLTWKDCFLEGNMIYHYRFLAWATSEGDLSSTPDLMTTQEYKYEAVNIDYIYLSDKDNMLAIQYNPNISNYKWVTQENITNTLGGVFPVIRQNGDTKYRQFSLSGTLYFNLSSDSGMSSNNQNMSQWFEEESCGLYLSPSVYNNFLYSNYKESVLQKHMRDYVMNFLTNRKPKLFRSGEEGIMIVYLSNISFTPNKTLGRQVWDFSATVTEICEATNENMKKYNLIQDNISYIIEFYEDDKESIKNSYYVYNKVTLIAKED